ncbi:DoxX family membrane protein [Streptomyces sp. NBC_01275]|uniref:DoxX family membrane protein n=1 Tax=Streptomyces sp. NBC_01275 TaxID=2903807 RepID=UPI00225079DA|nr:DoxX family membrane protein [Streptomyces sp. NBC_01275]MCX4763091.1 DoxX family membrane protein [Streptomyces sp. NBC_01275]
MSVDTRTPRTPTGDRSSGFDDAPALSMVKVPSDPAQIIVTHASFRVQLGASARRNQSLRIARHVSAIDDTARMPVVGAPGRAGAGARRRPVVWSGKSDPDDTGAHRLLQAVRAGSVGHGEPPTADAGATQVIPRVGDGGGSNGGYGSGYDGGYDGDLAAQTLETPVVGAQRAPAAGENRLLPHMRTVGSAYDEPGYDDAEFEDFEETRPTDGAGPRARRHAEDPARHAYFPGRRMNLGVVLLPLRVFLGFISIYAGMGKLCDPVYFDGGKRGSMVKWLNTLHPWEVAEPLRQLALHHPVGSGLVIAFLQVVVGVLTVLGCWQRVAAVVGALLSAALIVTVSWKTVPVYETPDIIYLAAWSPLIIAGAPVYSVDGRLAAGAWRRLGPRSDLWELRSYVLRRGALVTAIVVGLTLLVGSLLGGAVRDSDRVVVPGPGEAPRNELPGSPLPQASGKHKASRKPAASTSPTQDATSAAPTAGTDSAPSEARDSGTATTGAPSQTQGTGGQAPPQQSTPVEQAPSSTAGPTSGGSTSSGGGTGGSDGGTSSTGEPGLVGGLLG